MFDMVFPTCDMAFLETFRQCCLQTYICVCDSCMRATWHFLQAFKQSDWLIHVCDNDLCIHVIWHVLQVFRQSGWRACWRSASKNPRISSRLRRSTCLKRMFVCECGFMLVDLCYVKLQVNFPMQIICSLDFHLNQGPTRFPHHPGINDIYTYAYARIGKISSIFNKIYIARSQYSQIYICIYMYIYIRIYIHI